MVDGQRPAQLGAMYQSRFWQRLDDLTIDAPSADRKASIDHLKASPCGACIRELLQNALNLHQLRLKMKKKGEPSAFGDGDLIRRGWVCEPDVREAEPGVALDWNNDEETGQ
jgi:hypothetical protein